MQIKSGMRIVCSVLAFTLAIASPCATTEDYVLTPALPSAGALGSYTGDLRMALGEVTDAVWADDAKMIGMGPNGGFAIHLPTTRQESTQQLFQDLLQKSGLGVDSGDNALRLDVTVRRDRFLVDQSVGRYRLRTEVFLECTIRQGNEVVGRVMACGNAQTQAQVASKKKTEAVYNAGLQDAVFKLLRSKTFLRVVGSGWKPGTGEPPESQYEITRIDREKFYGPTDAARGELAKLHEALTAHQGEALVLQDFVMKDAKYEGQKGSRPDFASACIPVVIREHLDAFYPGAFSSVTRRAMFTPGNNVVLTGDLMRFKEGNVALRFIIGMGAGKDKLEAEIALQDGRDGRRLYTYHVLDSNWGAGWQAKQGQLRDMLDQCGRDLAYLLVSALNPNYAPPNDLEICFDGVPYPPLVQTISKKK